MIEGYQEFTLGVEGITYIQEQLQSVGKSLARVLLRVQIIKKGCVTTMLPTYVTEDAIKCFNAGPHKEPPPETHVIVTTPSGKRGRWVRKQTATACLIEVIEEFLSKGRRHVCIFEDYMGRPSDRRFQRGEVRSQVLVLGEELYPIVTWQDPTEQKIKTAITEAEAAWPPVIGAMTSIPEGHSLFEERATMKVGTLQAADLAVFAERTEKIIVGAYDGEGYLIWSRVQ